MSHFRILRDRGHRDDDALIAPCHEWKPWDCLVCLHTIDDGGLFCPICSAERGDWLCERCGHKNKKRSPECEECGTPKPENGDG